MRAYICRWQNGDFSLACATSREEADLLFDEIANPDLAQVFRAPGRFAIHFELQKNPDPADSLPVNLECFNEESYLDLGSKLYPILSALDEEAEPDAVQEAVEKERTRQWGKKSAFERQRRTTSTRSRTRRSSSLGKIDNTRRAQRAAT